MNSLIKVFQEKEDLLSVYFTAGYPNLNDTGDTIKYLQKYGADIIELGIPYSDPMADGETIQKSSSIALKNGINLDIVFEQLNTIKSEINIPLVIMGYLNQMLVYGLEKFLKSCRQTEVQALIIPDLPLDEYEAKYKKLFRSYGLNIVFLITPQTSDERIIKIDELSGSFIYMVSSASITGEKKAVSKGQIEYFKRIKKMKLKSPTLIGFGISNKKTFNTACKYSSGAIIGSAFIKALTKSGDLENNIKSFIKSIKE